MYKVFLILVVAEKVVPESNFSESPKFISNSNVFSIAFRESSWQRPTIEQNLKIIKNIPTWNKTNISFLRKNKLLTNINANVLEAATKNNFPRNLQNRI